MKIATWNVNSVLARLPLVLKWLEEAQPDVLCLQETKCVDAKFPAREFAELGYAAEIFGQPAYNGVAILARDECKDVQRGFPGDDAGAQSRLIAANVKGVRIVNVYIPNGASVGADKYYFKLQWMARLRSFFDEHYNSSAQVLICGDFNVAPEDLDVHDPQLWRGRILCSEPERTALEHIKGWGFTDAFRLHINDGGHFSWWDYRQASFRRNAGLRIDHIWVSDALAARSTKTWIDTTPRGWERPSDHTPVIAEFSD
ncbi:MAG: exodeoxyribonuclease III [Pyrinomonadaceae bacterium]